MRMSRVLYAPVNLPRLSAGEVHVWCAQLNLSAEEAEPLNVFLSDDERDRAGRFVFLRDRVRYVTARGILRRLLGRYLDFDPAEIRFSYGACGKPELRGCLAEPLRFNLSHAGDWAVYAISKDREVGIDIELLNGDIPWQQLAPSVFSLREQAEFAEIPLHEKPTAFLRGWTRKEAYVKCRGEGLSLALDGFDVPLGALTVPMRVETALTPEGGQCEWWLYPIAPQGNLIVTLAVEGPPVEQKTYRWPRCSLWMQA